MKLKGGRETERERKDLGGTGHSNVREVNGEGTHAHIVQDGKEGKC